MKSEASNNSTIAGDEAPSRRHGGLLRIGLAAAVGLLFLVSWTLRGSSSAINERPPLPILGVAPNFALVERNGQPVSEKDLLGKVWLANFVFTRCLGPCPKLSLRMKSIQSSLGQAQKDVVLVSFTLDPTYDTPSVLQTYARQYHAEKDRWWFLTCDDEAAMHRIVQEGFKQTVLRAAGATRFDHSTYFLLVDQVGRIRAYYHGLEPESTALILRDIDTLLHEPLPA